MFPVNIGDVLSSMLLCSVVLLVLVGNTLVVLAVATSRKLRTVTNIFIVNLACADLLLGVLVLPFSAVLEIKDSWVFGQIWCQVWLAVDVWLCTASILNLCCISFDRYLAITRPIRYPGLMSSRRAKTLVAGVWLFSFIIGCPPLIGWNDTIEDNIDFNGTTIYLPPVTTSTIATTQATYYVCDNEIQFSGSSHHNESCTKSVDISFIITCELTNSRGYRVYAALGSFFVPMLVMVFFYLQIYRAAIRTISAYEKGELKTKFSAREKANGQVNNSVTLRIHRGGHSFSTRSSASSHFTGSVYNSRKTPASKECNVEKDKEVRNLGRDDGCEAQASIGKARSSDASLVTLTDVSCEGMNNGNINRCSMSGTAQKSSKSLCWRKERKCHECRKHSMYNDTGQNGRHAQNRLCGMRCISMDSEESSSNEVKARTKQAGDFHKASTHNTESSIPSTSCHVDETEMVLVRGVSTTENKHRRPRFSTQKPANAMRLHMQKFNREKKAAKTLAVIVGAFIMCWMPFFTIYLVGAFCDGCISQLLFSVAFWLGYCNSAMNPCVYALFSRDFRFAFRKLLTCGCETWHKNRNLRMQNSDVPAIQLHCAPQDDARSSSDIDGQWR